MQLNRTHTPSYGPGLGRIHHITKGEINLTVICHYPSSNDNGLSDGGPLNASPSIIYKCTRKTTSNAFLLYYIVTALRPNGQHRTLINVIRELELAGPVFGTMWMWFDRFYGHFTERKKRQLLPLHPANPMPGHRRDNNDRNNFPVPCIFSSPFCRQR